jgi:hypothetical protein
MVGSRELGNQQSEARGDFVVEERFGDGRRQVERSKEGELMKGSLGLCLLVCCGMTLLLAWSQPKGHPRRLKVLRISRRPPLKTWFGILPVPFRTSKQRRLT